MFLKKNFPPAVLFPLACLVLGTALLSGCKPVEDPGLLEGTWKDVQNMDSYVIDSGKVVYDDGGDYGETGMDLIGTVRYHTDFDKPAGLILIEYTSPETLKGKINAIYWKDLTSSSVSLSVAYNTDYTNPGEETLEAAKTKFTLDNSGDWVSYWGGPYTKQK